MARFTYLLLEIKGEECLGVMNTLFFFYSASQILLTSGIIVNMHLTHETSRATLIQLMIIGLMNIINTIASIVSHCTHSNGQCAINMLTSTVLYIGIIVSLIIIAAFGYLAQSKRTKNSVRILIVAELIVFFISAVNIKFGMASHVGGLSLFTNFFALVLSVWVITLAFRLKRAGGGRVVNRRRRHTEEKVPPL